MTDHTPQQESFATDGGYIEFKDQENQEKCVALIKDLISSERIRLLDEVRGLVNLRKYSQSLLLGTPETTERVVNAINSTLDDLLKALDTLGEK